MIRRVLRLKDVKKATGLSRSSIYALRKRGLFPPSVKGVVVWRGLTDVSFGTTVRLPRDGTTAPPEADRAVYGSLRRWMEEIAGYDFASDVTVRHAYPASTISYDDAARHIDRLSSSLEKVVSEIRSL